MCFNEKIVIDSNFPRRLCFSVVFSITKENFIWVLHLPVTVFGTHVFDAHAQVPKRVADLHDDGSIKPFSAVEGREADYVHRCCRLSANMWAS